MTQPANDPLANPIVRIVVATAVLYSAFWALSGLLYQLIRFVGVGERFLLDNLWNLPRFQWLAILVALAAWFVVGMVLQTLDQTLVIVSAAAFAVMAVILDNLLFDLPDALRDLYGMGRESSALLAAVVAFLALQRASASPAPSAAAPAPAPAATAAPRPAAPSAAAPAAPSGGPAGEPGWLPDPRGQARLRWWDGSAWTEHTHDG